MYIPGLQNIRRREILLFGGKGCLFWRGNAEPATFVLVEESAEDRGRVKVGPGVWVLEGRRIELGEGSLPAHEINTSIHADEGAGVHVANQTVVFDWQVTRRMSTARLGVDVTCRHGAVVVRS